MLEPVGLGDRLHYYPNDLSSGQMSSGQKQRVAIARTVEDGRVAKTAAPALSTTWLYKRDRF